MSVNQESCCSKSKCDCNCKWEQEQYMEIYKLQVQTITETSNRRTNVNRYYILALSVLALALSAVMRGSDVLFNSADSANSTKVFDRDSIGIVIMVIGMLGGMLSYSWIRNISRYLYANSNRYEAIKKLECKMSHSFINDMWDFIKKREHHIKQNPNNGEDITYFQLSLHDVYAPFIFSLGFIMLMIFGAWHVSAETLFLQFFLIASFVGLVFMLFRELYLLKYRSYS